MTKNLRISLIMVSATVVALFALVAFRGGDDDVPPAASVDERLVRPDSQKLNYVPRSSVTFVEFLDFECEACGAAFPLIEELRTEYGDRVTFVVRNFPLHANSEGAASAAEAAARQGKFEEMYQRLFETQAEWGEKRTSQREVFFGFARDLGLDMGQFLAAYEDPATVAKIKRDKADGVALDVSSTPTFFLNGVKLEPRTSQDLVDSIEQALEE